MSNQTKRQLLYLYILGSKNKADRISTLVPFRINDEEIFYGPCKKSIRGEIRKLFPSRDIIYPERENYEIYLVGINPAKGKKERKVPRSILFAGKIKKIFTFESAWKYYNNRAVNDENLAKMINGIENLSPLHLEPKYDKNNGKFIGYKHRTKEHKRKWLEDILSQNEKRNLTKEEENSIYENDEIILNEQLQFERDCCFELDNIFLSYKNHICPIELDEIFLDLIRKRLEELNHKERLNAKGGPDIFAPFGYNENGDRYGRGFELVFEGDDVIKFITEIFERCPQIFIVNVGVNTSYGLMSPLFEDNSFEFVPIKEEKNIIGPNISTYEDLLCFNSNDKLIKYLPERRRNIISKYRVHNDPEFDTFTYGDIIDSTKPKSAKLSLVKKGDFLFFIANLTKYQYGKYLRNSGEFYFIGYLEVEDVYSKEEEIKANTDKIKNNAHYKRLLDNYSNFGDFRIVKGNENSKRFKYPFKVTKEFCDDCLRLVSGRKFNWNKFSSITGCIGSTTRAIRPYINKAKQPSDWKSFWNWINKYSNRKSYKIDAITSIFDKIIESAIENREKSDEILIDNFTRFRENMKEWKGKAPLITGIIELLYFEYIKRYIQKALKINEYVKKQSGNPKSPVYLFSGDYNNKKVILCSDIQIGEESHIKLKLRNPETDKPLKIQPDIFIGIEDEASKIIPIAFIEIKLYTTMKDFHNKVFKRFENIKNSINLHYPTYKPYFIVINAEAYKSDNFDNEFEEFQKNFDRFLYLKRDWDADKWNKDKKAWETPFKGYRINQILDLIIALINDEIVNCST